MNDEKPMGQAIQIDEARIRDHLGEMVRGAVEEALNAMLDAEDWQLRADAADQCRITGIEVCCNPLLGIQFARLPDSIQWKRITLR